MLIGANDSAPIVKNIHESAMHDRGENGNTIRDWVQKGADMFKSSNILMKDSTLPAARSSQGYRVGTQPIEQE